MILTRACNLKCRYCGEDPLFEQPPIDIVYSIETLQNFLSKDKSDITIQFYGGEPLIRIPKMEQIMDAIPNVKHWSIQTNGIALDKITSTYLKKTSTILVSLDGRESVTDVNRGEGVYKKIIDNCVIARRNGFNGDLVARMTVSEESDIFEEVVHLATIKSQLFNHIHWQLDTQWDDDPKTRWKDFTRWVEKSYNPGISKLVHWWVEQMANGTFIGIVPFIPVMKSILFNEPSELRCGAGLDSFAINPDGSISVCPISPEFEFSIVGNINKETPQSIRNSMKVIRPCPECNEFELCGGRCLFINKTKLWGDDLFDKVCETVKHMINELKPQKEKILELIRDGIISKEQLDYPLYNNGCEIIP
ncbi:MAG: TIGR04084 family radical SAM/SPASM domain-containing protein [Asgard group archaeon]|nr:TIGR04084 family radical SAM/SPASM domain-containing protein [Asgard group archaeon]